MTQDVKVIAEGLAKVERVVACRCGDVHDRFPCTLCGAHCPRECGVSAGNRWAARDAINAASAATNGSGLDAVRDYLRSQGEQA